MKKYIVDLSGRLVRNFPTGWSGTNLRWRRPGVIPHLADRRHEMPMNPFEKIVCLIFAGAVVLFGLVGLWHFVGPSITDTFTTGWRTNWR
jgi:hypothetical protein